MPLSFDDEQKSLSSPTSEVHSLLPRLRRAIYAAERAGGVPEDSDAVSKLKNAHRALRITSHLNDLYLVAVSGRQGSGKTSLVQSLYGIPDDYLSTRTGTGEKIPVLVVEENHQGGSSDSFRAAVHRYHRGQVSEEWVEADTARKTAETGKKDSIMVELRVPPKVFGREKQGFLLLPGSEWDQDRQAGTKKTTTYTDLVRHILPCASTALICVDSTRAAQRRTREEIRQANEDLEGVSPLYALTKADQSSDGNEELKTTLTDALSIDDSNRIIAVDNPPLSQSERNVRSKDWNEDLKSALERYSAAGRAHHRAQEREMGAMISDVRSALEDIEERIDILSAQTEMRQDSSLGPCLDTFDEEVESVRNDLKRHLENQIQGAGMITDAARQITDEIRDESVWSKAGRVIVSEDLSDQVDFQKMVDRAWEDQNPERRILASLNSVVQSRIPRRPRLPGSGQNDDPSASLPEGDVSSQVGSLVLHQPQGEERNQELAPVTEETLTDDTVGDIQALMNANSSSGGFSSSLVQSTRAIPALALDAVRIGFVGRTRPSDVDDIVQEDSDPVGEIEEVRGDSKKMLTLLGAMLGADYVPDAEVDIIKDLLTAGGVGQSAAATVAGPVVAGLAAAYGTVSAIKLVNAQDIGRADAGRAAIKQLSERTVKNVLSQYDSYMADIRRRMKGELEDQFGVGRRLSEQANLKTSVEDVRKGIDALPTRIVAQV